MAANWFDETSGEWANAWWTTPANVATATEYDRFGQPVATYGNPALAEPGAALAANGLLPLSASTYDGFGQLERSLAHSIEGTAETLHTYDPAGRVLTVARVRPGGTDTQQHYG